jgi:hypothetical protein
MAHGTMMHDAIVAGSAWAGAVHIGQVRDAAVVAGIKSSVRALARAENTSPGRFGDLLKIREAFRDEDADCVGVFSGPEVSRIESVETIGHRRLSRLSFRTLRKLAGMSWRERIVGAWRQASALENDRSDSTRETSDGQRTRGPRRPKEAI